MRFCLRLAVLMLAAGWMAHAEVVERVEFDWNHSGQPTLFTLLNSDRITAPLSGDRLIIKTPHRAPWSLVNRDGAWGSLRKEGMSKLLKQNAIVSNRFLFIATSTAPDARFYLILKGVSGGLIGALTVLTPTGDGTPKVVFTAKRHLLSEVLLAEDGAGIDLIGQSDDAEARGLKNAQSYDPYRVYRLRGDAPARLDVEASKQYTVAHYCQWAGPDYDERFVAVGIPDGAVHCQVMSSKAFQNYAAKY